MKPPCVVLAGGRSRRMGGGDKCLLPLAGRPMLSHVLDVLTPQTCAILINSNSEPELFARFGAPVAADVTRGFLGPLAGLLTGMVWAHAHYPDATHLLSAACDTPFLPANLAARLEESLTSSGAEIAIACDQEDRHPVIGLWPLRQASRLATDLAGGTRAIHRWMSNFEVNEVAFADHHFHNINTRAELLEAERQSALPMDCPTSLA